MTIIDYIPRSLRKVALGIGLALTLAGCTNEVPDSSQFASADSHADINKVDGTTTDIGYDAGRTQEDITSQDAGIDSFIKPDTQDIAQTDIFVRSENLQR